jgi:hypothetical protein
MYEYLLQTGESKQSDRMIREYGDGEIENGKISKDKRRIMIDKKKPKKSEYSFTVNKPRRMIRKEQ